MTAPIPLSPAEREALARAVMVAWPDCARKAGVDAKSIGAEACADGRLDATWVRQVIPGIERPLRVGTVARAIEELARDLEDEGFAVDRTDGIRVVGWAPAPPGMVVRDPGLGCQGIRQARIVDLDAIHPARAAYHDRLRVERHQRDAAVAPGPNVKIEGARARARGAGR